MKIMDYRLYHTISVMISYVNVKRVALRHRKESHKLSQTPFSSLPFEFCC